MEKLDGFAPHLKPLLREVVQPNKLKIGITAGNIIMKDLASGSVDDGEHPVCLDRFKILIPYGGINLYWEVVFLENDKEQAPDFDFNDDMFNPDIERLKSFSSWNSKNKYSFVQILNELITEYRDYQLEKVSKNIALQEICTSIFELAEKPDFSMSSFEVYIETKGRNNTVNVLIKLPLDFSSIPLIYKKGCFDDEAILFIRITETTKLPSQLILTKDLQKFLSILGPKNVQIPQIQGDHSLSDYVFVVTEYLNEKIELLVTNFHKRRNFFFEIFRHIKGDILDFDIEYFTSITLLLELKGLAFQLSISVPQNFPAVAPICSLSSVYQMSRNKGTFPLSLTVKFDNNNFNPNWSSAEMFKATMSLIKENIEAFRNLHKK